MASLPGGHIGNCCCRAIGVPSSTESLRGRPNPTPLLTSSATSSCWSKRTESERYSSSFNAATNLVDNSSLHHEAHLCHDAYVGERVAIDGDQVRELAGRHAAEILVMPQQLCRADGRCLEHKHLRHARVDHQFELMRVFPMRIDAGIGT